MRSLKFPESFKRKHSQIRNVNEIINENKTAGQRLADTVASVMGSWRFIILQSFILTGWVILNLIAWVQHWDPYPFILMNLVLSLQAAYAAPIIMMSQNRQAERDRLEAHNDYLINKKAEEEVHVILEHNSAQNEALLTLHKEILKMQELLNNISGKSF